MCKGACRLSCLPTFLRYSDAAPQILAQANLLAHRDDGERRVSRY